ncbi:MAG: (2Fe-2S)-binding protein [Thermomicrobiaceae bacterium]
MPDIEDRLREYICRCEEIPHSAVRQAIQEGNLTLNDVKRRTRAGMGVCQGIYCLRSVALMIEKGAGVAADSLEPMTARPPARLITLGSLAALNPED